MKNLAISKPEDTVAANITFGIEIETIIPANAGVVIGNYHSGTPVIGGTVKSNGAYVIAPAGWKAECDGSIATIPGFIACEFVSPILSGEAGVQNMLAMVAFIKLIGGKVNTTCGCHITIGTASVIGTNDTKAVTAFCKKVATVAQHNAWAIFAQTAPGRHTNRYSKAFSSDVGELMEKAAAATDSYIARKNTIACGRGMVNFQKALRSTSLIEFRAFAGTLNATRLSHHLATVLAIVRRAQTAQVLGSFKRSAKHSKAKTATDAVCRMWRVMGWVNPAEGREVALGIFGSLKTNFPAMGEVALANAANFEVAFPSANL